MMANRKSNWIIGIGNSEADGVSLHRVYGSKAAVKRHLVSIVKEDKLNDSEGFDYGTTAVKDVEEESGTLHAYAVFSDYHIDYTAKPETEPIVL